MSVVTEKYLRNILFYLNDVEQFAGDGREVFLNSRLIQRAVERTYEIVGEILKRLPDELLATQAHIQWDEIIRFRDFLAHNYDRVRSDLVWSAIEQLPALREAVNAMLAHEQSFRTSEHDQAE